MLKEKQNGNGANLGFEQKLWQAARVLIRFIHNPLRMFSAQKPEEFIVEEILPDGTQLELDKPVDQGIPEEQTMERDYFTHFIFQKYDWNTLDALGALSFRLHVKPGRFNCAGNKDKKAITIQRASAFAVAPERLLSANVKDVKILSAWKAKEKVKLGDLGGNRFTITLTEQNCGQNKDPEKIIEKAREQNYQMLNLFGPQRFGSQRQNTAKVGEHLLKGDYEAAAWEAMAGEGNESPHISEARKRLRQERDFAAALSYFPQHLKSERRILEHLARIPTDFVGAFRKLPRTLALLYVHAFQSDLFNQYVKENEGDFVCDANSLGFPDLAAVRPKTAADEKALQQGRAFPVAQILGYQTQPSESEKTFLESKGISLDFFKLKSMPELSSKGAFRAVRVPLKDFEVLDEKPLRIRFALPPGAYAT
ncbi:MAG TPA: tRNA pseudouridine(13) synthase TruD, partial [Candidatus Norongarragalinales archaeon]|nr:tRNA pseudouridine(13) synthase TruD [Candidatus Norongarragalinales archaeon]